MQPEKVSSLLGQGSVFSSIRRALPELLLPEKRCTPLLGPLLISTGPVFRKLASPADFPTFPWACRTMFGLLLLGFFLEFSGDAYCLSSVCLS